MLCLTHTQKQIVAQVRYLARSIDVWKKAKYYREFNKASVLQRIDLWQKKNKVVKNYVLRTSASLNIKIVEATN